MAARLYAKRVTLDADRFVSGTVRSAEDLRRRVEEEWTKAGDRLVSTLEFTWPVDTGKQKTGIKGTARKTKAGRLIYTVRVPFPAGFYEFGTKRQPPRPTLRPAMAQTRRELMGR